MNYQEYLRRIQGSGLSPAQLLALDEELLIPIVYGDALEQSHGGRKADDRYQTIAKNLDRYCSELNRRGVTRQLLWEEYRKEHAEGYAYSQFCEYLRDHTQKHQAVMRFIHQAGEQLQVDFAGDKFGYIDITTGEWKPCEVLVCTMPGKKIKGIWAKKNQTIILCDQLSAYWSDKDIKELIEELTK